MLAQKPKPPLQKLCETLRASGVRGISRPVMFSAACMVE